MEATKLRTLLKVINLMAGVLVVLAALYAPLFDPYGSYGVTGSSTFGLIIFIIALELQYLPFVARRIREPVRTVCATALLGLLCGAASMLLGTMLLGHVRPMWMEFKYAGQAASKGIGYGVVLGLVLGFANRLWHKKLAG